MECLVQKEIQERASEERRETLGLQESKVCMVLRDPRAQQGWLACLALRVKRESTESLD